MPAFSQNISPSNSRPAPRDMRTVNAPALSTEAAQVQAEVSRLAVNLSQVCKLGMTAADYSRLSLQRLRELDALRQAAMTANSADDFANCDPNDPMKPTAREAALDKLEQSAKRPAGWYDLNALNSGEDEGSMLRLVTTVRTAVAGASPQTLIGLGRDVLESLKRKLEG